MNSLKILICDDNLVTVTEFSDYFENKNIVVEFCKKDGITACEKIKLINPDIVITDIFLPGIDGISLVDKFKNIENSPLFFALSCVDNNNAITLALNNGFEYYFLKPCDLDTVYNRILMILEQNREQETYDIITDTLHYIGVPTHLLGYSCIKSGIELVLKNPQIIYKVTTQLYPEIARTQNSTARRTERAIRTAVEITWDKGNICALKEIFPYNFENYKKPSSSEFIATVCDYIRSKYKKCSRF